MTVVVCRGPVCGGRRDAAALTAHLSAHIARRGLGERVRVSEEICLGHCSQGPNVLVCEGRDGEVDGEVSGSQNGSMKRAVLYNRMTVSDLDRVLDRHLVGGIAVRPLMHRPPARER
jgi:(2Fe-2S) ferredoxin